MKKCYGYIRVSTVKQGDGVSLEAQKDAIEAFATRNNLIISKWFEEKETAAKRGRPIFNRMVTELKQKKADGLIIHKIDRSARNFADWAKIGDLADIGIDIHFATESLDFSSRGGRLTADIQAVIAADYIRNLREECIKGIQGRLKQGLYPFKAPIGYLDNGGGKPKTIDPVKGPLVRQLFELYATGNYSIKSLAKETKRLGLFNDGGKPLAKTTVEQILKNPFYTGIIKIKRTNQVYPGIHEPLISASLFEKVTAIRTGRYHKKVTKHQHRYRGLFRCGHCSGAMIPELQKGRVYYRCHLKSCATKTLREDHIEEAVLNFLRPYTCTTKQLNGLQQRLKQFLDVNNQNTSIKQAQFELTKLDQRLSTLEDKLLDEVIDNDTYQRKKTDILLNRQHWLKITQKPANQQLKLQRLNKFLELIKSLYLNYISAVSAQKRELIKFATSNRQVFAKKVELEPSKWLSLFDKVLNLDYCGPPRPTSRTFSEIESLLNQFETEDCEKILDQINDIGESALDTTSCKC